MESRGTNSAQLDFSQAMTDFKIMFPNMDVDVIEAVLRSNNGAVDATIDQLLTMTADNETGDNSLPSYTEAVDRVDSVGDLLGAASLEDTGGGGAAGGGARPLWRIKNWNPPLLGTLPPDFLRLTHRGLPAGARPGHAYTHPDRPQPHHHHHGQAGARARPSQPPGEAVTERQQQMLEDEKFAMMLQNEEFMRELRGNQEFMSALEEDHNHDFSQTDFQHQQLDKPREQGGGSRRPHLGMDDAMFREKLKNMGKSSKQKFAKLATMFSRQRGVSRVLGQSGQAPSKDNLLLNTEPAAHTR